MFGLVLGGFALVLWATGDDGGSGPGTVGGGHSSATTSTTTTVTADQARPYPSAPAESSETGPTTSMGTGRSLGPPTNVTATVTPGRATVSVGWTGVIGPDGSAVDGYYVQRYAGTTPSPACSSAPSALHPAMSTSCSDTSVADGTYTYAVTAVFRSLTAESTPSAAVTVAALSFFEVTAPATTTAGTPFTVTVTAKDAAGTTITGYLGTVHFTSSDPNASALPANYTYVSSDDGTHTFTNGVTLTKTPPARPSP